MKKRGLSLFLVLCLVLNLLSVGAFAVSPGSDTVLPSAHRTPNISIHREDAAQSAAGHWTATAVESNGNHVSAQTPAFLQELHQAAEIYDEDELVLAFIVLEGRPLSERYSSKRAVPASAAATMKKQQESVIHTVEKQVMDGEKLEIRYQFTYLTNAVTVRVPFGKLAQIAQLEGVKTVFLTPEYHPATVSAADMTGVAAVRDELGYTGKGMTIAVIDTGLDIDHPSFMDEPETTADSMTEEDVALVLEELNAKQRVGNLTASKLYLSAKIPYAFNYVDSNLTVDHDHDQQGDHGTHVSGIAAANASWYSEVQGMAPDAQLVVMKVFGAKGGAFEDDIIAALEDALTLGVDVVNMSLGSPAGFTTANAEIDDIYERIAQQDTIVSVAAGNEGVSSTDNLLGTGLNRTSDPDNATVSSPATYKNTTTVASAENNSVMSYYFNVGEAVVAYSDAVGINAPFAMFAGMDMDYVMVPGIGAAEDFETVDVAEKVAVISRGDITFAEKLANAEAAGAVAVVIYNNQPGTIGMQMVDDEGMLYPGISGEVPAVSVSMQAGQLMAEAEEKVLTVGWDMGPVDNDDAGQISEFSSWGVAPDLTLLPDLTGVGGNVYSTVNNGEYDTMSGTSMAAPQVAGSAALVMQYLRENTELSVGELRTVAEQLLMSTAVPIIDKVSGVEASPRQQGAGLVNAAGAVGSEAYLTVSGCAQPKASLGEADENGSFTFEFSVHNFGGMEQTFTFGSSLLTEDAVEIDGGLYMAGHDRALTGTVEFSVPSVTVAPGGSEAVTVSITLSDADKAWFAENDPNGGYVEGFVYAEGETTLSLPFMGFYGQWAKAPIFDSGYWYDEAFWDLEAEPTAAEYYHVVWTSLGIADWVLGGNPYTAEMGPDENCFVVSNNGDGFIDGISEIYFSNLRNIATLTIRFENAETGEVYSTRTLEKLNKTMFVSSYGQIVPALYSWYDTDLYDFTDAEGKPLPNGTKLVAKVDAALEYDSAAENESSHMEFPVNIDTEAPALLGVQESNADGNSIQLVMRDNFAVAAAYLYDSTGTHVIAELGDNELTAMDGAVTATVDITGMGNEFLLYVCDYGANESAFRLKYETEDNLPEAPAAGLYGYRVADDNFSYGDDSFFGWVSIDPETAEVTQLTTDVMEYYAINSADYAAGYVFGVDAGHNFVSMIPGLWTRTLIRPLPVDVTDMTFDDENRVMYALAHDEDQIGYLYIIDLYTGRLTEVANFGYYKEGPINIAAVDGVLYTVYHSQNKLFRLDPETFEPVEVCELGEGIDPYYSQSMTYSRQDGKLYYTYYDSSFFFGTHAKLLAIDPETLEIETKDFANGMEFVGLTTLERETVQDFVCPENEKCAATMFNDVNTTDWFHLNVDEMVALGIMKGVAEDRFAPFSTLTRGMMATVLYRYCGAPETDGVCPFEDVAQGIWYEDAVIWAVENGITTGVSATRFAPNAPVTREQIVTFLYRMAAANGLDVTLDYASLDHFTDADLVDVYAVAPMRWAVAVGIIGGVSADRLAPRNNTNRAQICAMLSRYRKIDVSRERMEVRPVSEVLLDEAVTLAVGTVYQLNVLTLPWNTPALVAWTSSNPAVAAVEDGVVIAQKEGTATISATCNDVSVNCEVTVVKIEGTAYAYNYFNTATDYGDWIRFDLSSLPGYESLGASPVDFVSAEYNAFDGCLYGYDETFQCWRVDTATGKTVALGMPTGGVQVTDMAMDYSSGLMYCTMLDQMTGGSFVANLNLKNGNLLPVAYDEEFRAYMTLACSTEGEFFAITTDGVLCKLTFEDGVIMAEEMSDLGFGPLNYFQSMCYDHNNDQLIWAACLAYSSLVWIDPNSGAALAVGSPTGDTGFQYMAITTVPDELPELEYVPVTSVDAAADLNVLEGGSKAVNVSIEPLNATNQTIEWVIEDETIATVDADGVVTGLCAGDTVLHGTLVDGENTYTLTVNVHVSTAAGSVYGYVLADFGYMFDSSFIRIDPTDVSAPEGLAPFGYTLYSAEYVDGLIYAYGYDPDNWEAPTMFFTIDAESFDILNAVEVPNCPDVYDLTYDYTRGVLFAAAGYSDTASDLYVIDLASGTPILLMNTDPFFLAIAADENGDLYGMASSEEIMGDDGWPMGHGDAALWKIDPDSLTLTEVGSTGVKNNMMTSMAYDYSSHTLYWAALYHMDFFSPIESGFYMVDPATAETEYLGVLGGAGMQIGSLYIPAENHPETVDGLSALVLDTKQAQMSVGEELAIRYLTVGTNEAVVTWESSDETVATVADGVVTAVGSGVAVITATATCDGVTRTATCRVVVFDESDRILAYSATMGGWASISRTDSTDVELVKAIDEKVTAAAYAGDQAYAFSGPALYAVGEDLSLEFIGLNEWAMEERVGVSFAVRDMAYDAATGTMYAVAASTFEDEDGNIMEGTNTLYTVDLTTGEMLKVCDLDRYQIYGMTFDGQGNLIVYSSGDDSFNVVDISTGITRMVATSQSNMIYGHETSLSPLCYDEMTGLIYWMQTGNGKTYHLYTLDPVTYSFAEVGDVGQTTYNPATWQYEGDTFCAMLIK